MTDRFLFARRLLAVSLLAVALVLAMPASVPAAAQEQPADPEARPRRPSRPSKYKDRVYHEGPAGDLDRSRLSGAAAQFARAARHGPPGRRDRHQDPAGGRDLSDPHHQFSEGDPELRHRHPARRQARFVSARGGEGGPARSERERSHLHLLPRRARCERRVPDAVHRRAQLRQEALPDLPAPERAAGDLRQPRRRWPANTRTRTARATSSPTRARRSCPTAASSTRCRSIRAGPAAS